MGVLLQPIIESKGVEMRLDWGDTACKANSAQHEPAPVSLGAETNHPLNTAWPKERPMGIYVDRDDVPTLILQGWQDFEAKVTGGVELYQDLKTPTRLILQNGGHLIYERPKDIQAVMGWMDHWLRGINNGINTEPPVNSWWEVHTVDGVPTPRWTSAYHHWSVPRARWKRFYLTGSGNLSMTQPTAGREAAPRSSTYPDGTELIAENAQFSLPPTPDGILTYRTPPLSEDRTILGRPNVALHASAEQNDTGFMVVLHDTYPNGDTEYWQRGFQRAFLSGRDPERSTPSRAFHPCDKIEKLVPGQVYKTRISLPPIGAVSRKGHRLELAIMAPSPTNPPDWGWLPLSLPGRNTIYDSSLDRSILSPPIVPGAKAAGPALRFAAISLLPAGRCHG